MQPLGAKGPTGRYVVHGEIASGGMATVHYGRLVGPAGFGRTVAIKRLHAHLAKDPEFVAMLLDEARLAARVHHPNVVGMIDVVATESDVFLVMEYVNGVSLATLARRARERGDRVPPRVAAAIVAGILQGLHAAHDATDERGRPLGVVHRDVSPQNVLLGTEGIPRVVDFGVAKAAGRSQTTRDGQLKGKLGYMAPEQIGGGAVDRRSDVFAAGVVLWELLAGERLFDADNEGAVLARVVQADVAPPSARAPDVPAELDEVVLRALAREPSRRFSSARAMASALERAATMATPSEVGDWVSDLAGDLLRERVRTIASMEAGDGGAGATIEAYATDVSPPRRRRAVAWVVGIGLVAALTLGGLWVMRARTTAAAAAIPRASASLPSPQPEPPTASAAETALAAAPPPTATATSTSTSTSTSTPTPAARATAPRPTATTTAKPSCSPPFTIDEHGFKKYKVECL